MHKLCRISLIFLCVTPYILLFFCRNQTTTLVREETGAPEPITDTFRSDHGAIFHGEIVKSFMQLIPSDFDGQCHNVLNTTIGRDVTLSASYRKGIPQMDKKVRSIGEHATQEGYIVHESQVKLLHHLVRMEHVRTVCETGFNVGYSAFNYLTAKKSVKVYSFDIGRWLGTKIMAHHLQDHFKDRLFVHYGDSVESIPQFITKNPDFRCDLVLVDGGHFYKVARHDLRNFARLSVPGKTLVVIDDYPTNWAMPELAPAWEGARMEGIITEIFRCSEKTTNITGREFGVGFSVALFS